MKNFSKEKAKDKLDDWKSPAMYTHVFGYKFCIGVDANGHVRGRGKSIILSVWSIPGEYDDQLIWPARAKFTIELINQQGGENAFHTTKEMTWEQPEQGSLQLFCFSRVGSSQTCYFIEHSKLDDFHFNDTLHFCVSKVEVVNSIL